MVRNFEDLKVWAEAVALAESVYRLTADFPKSELYGLTTQMRRAAVSEPSNIAEGHARGRGGGLQYCLAMSAGSLAELKTQVILAQRLNLTSRECVSSLLNGLDRVGGLLGAFRRSVRATEKLATDNSDAHGTH